VDVAREHVAAHLGDRPRVPRQPMQVGDALEQMHEERARATRGIEHGE
jgi:hypothetical protein